ncbi:hypothetical protein HDU67_010430, partial [Dinochytrium kinnereticum]
MVKNLPKHLTVERFKDHFSAKGETAKEAKAALKYFNNTFIDTSKIEVVEAKAVGDASLPRPWSKHTDGSSAHQKRLEAQKANEKARLDQEERLQRHREALQIERENKQKFVSALYAAENDPKLKEFLEVMRPRSSAKQRIWANDDLGVVDGASSSVRRGAAGVQAEVAVVRNRKAGGEGMLVTRTHVRFGADVDGEEEEEYQDLAGKQQQEEVEEEVVREEDKTVHDAKVSDLDYFRSRMKSSLDDDGSADEKIEEEEEEEEQDSESPTPHPTPPQDEPMATESPPSTTNMTAENSAPKAWDPTLLQQSVPDRARLKEEVETPPASIIADTGRLFVKNLSYTCCREDLEKLFGRFGPLSEIHISIDKETKKPKGYAFILYLLPEHAVKAYAELDNSIFQGRILEVLPGKERPVVNDAWEGEGENTSSFKRRREVKRR